MGCDPEARALLVATPDATDAQTVCGTVQVECSADGGTGIVVWMYQMHASSFAGSLKTCASSTSP